MSGSGDSGNPKGSGDSSSSSRHSQRSAAVSPTDPRRFQSIITEESEEPEEPAGSEQIGTVRSQRSHVPSGGTYGAHSFLSTVKRSLTPFLIQALWRHLQRLKQINLVVVLKLIQ